MCFMFVCVCLYVYMCIYMYVHMHLFVCLKLCSYANLTTQLPRHLSIVDYMILTGTHM